MIQLLLALQVSVSALYYLTAPFHLNALVLLFWFANSASCIYLLKNHLLLAGELPANMKYGRLAFTLTLIISEIVITFASDSYESDNFHTFISDMEVLLTGMTLGVLWHYEITNKFKRIF